LRGQNIKSENFVKDYFSLAITFFCGIVSPMKLTAYLDYKKVNVFNFAKQHGLSVATVWRASRGKTVRPKIAAQISDATDGMVTRLDLLYPQK